MLMQSRNFFPTHVSVQKNSHASYSKSVLNFVQ